MTYQVNILKEAEQEQVFIHAVLDGRRDMQTLLEARMLAG